ncbi:hypothetical protein SynA1825c_00698 [Synechococcus sp. A18-25c]|nr:hypothetical protein SynA1825c_00698 [Synechococcus sp. A18-25c]
MWLRNPLSQQELQGRARRSGAGHEPQKVSPSGLLHRLSLCLNAAHAIS